MEQIPVFHHAVPLSVGNTGITTAINSMRVSAVIGCT